MNQRRVDQIDAFARAKQRQEQDHNIESLQRTEAQAANTEAARRAEMAAQADGLMQRLPNSFRDTLMVRVRFAALEQGALTRQQRAVLTDTLPQLLAHVTTAINEGWLDELIGRIERDTS